MPSSKSSCSSTSSSSSSDSCASRASKKSKSSKSSRFSKRSKSPKRSYDKLKRKLQRDFCLQVSGSDAFGSVYNQHPVCVPVGKAVHFKHNQNLLNVHHKPEHSEVKVERDGTYFVTANLFVDQPCEFALFINDCVERSTVTALNAGASMLNIQQIMRLKKCDVLTLRNYKSTKEVSTYGAAAGCEPSVSVNLMLYKIAPLLGCCPSPCSPKRPRKCSKRSGKKSKRSKCSKKSKHSKHSKRSKCSKKSKHSGKKSSKRSNKRSSKKSNKKSEKKSGKKSGKKENLSQFLKDVDKLAH
jgi:hypothetical protein